VLQLRQAVPEPFEEVKRMLGTELINRSTIDLNASPSRILAYYRKDRSFNQERLDMLLRGLRKVYNQQTGVK